MNLTPYEARVIGCLLEKEITTPEQYPLSLNSLTLACNQKSSRDPVMALSENDTQITLDSLSKKRLIAEQSGFGSRVVKYKHRFCNTEFSDLQLTSAQVAIICLLLLRGPQTPGELRTRSNRLHTFADVAEVDQALKGLSNMQTPLAQQLPREPGKRECRFTELISQPGIEYSQHSVSSTTQISSGAIHSESSNNKQPLIDRVQQLELEVAELKVQLAQLLSNKTD